MKDILEKIEWAKMTINERLEFGMGDTKEAAYSRERRACAVLMDCKRAILDLQEKTDALEKEVNMYRASEKLLDAGISGSHLEVGKALAKQVIKLKKEIERLKGSKQNPSSNA